MACGHLFLLIGPSGSGKTSIIQRVTQEMPQVRFLPTSTTRPPRPTEKHGREYFFMTDEEFDEALARGEFLEWQWIHGNRYGTSRRRIMEALERGEIIIMSVDVLGGLVIRKELKDCSTAIFVRPSSTAQLRERLEKRGDAAESIEQRLERVQKELALAHESDFLVINDNGHLDDAVEAVEKIIRQVTGIS